MRKARLSVLVVDQSNHTPSDAISLGSGVIGFSVTNPPNSNNNVFVGLNGPATMGNLVIVGDSKPYGNYPGYLLDDNKLYIGFDPSGSGGVAVVVIAYDGGPIQEFNEC